MKTEFHISFKQDGVYQARIVIAETKALAERWFRFVEPTAVVVGVSSTFDYKPGKPVEIVPDCWGVEFDERYDSDEYNTTTLYFTAPKELLPDDYPDAVSAEISIEFLANHPFYHEASVMISPTNAEGNDYDWDDWLIDAGIFDKLVRIAEENHYDDPTKPYIEEA